MLKLRASFFYSGKNPTDEYLDAMMNEAPGPINFTMFLTMFGEKLNGTDPEDVIRNAFACFDEEASGWRDPGTGRGGHPTGTRSGPSIPGLQCPVHMPEPMSPAPGSAANSENQAASCSLPKQ